MKGGGRISRIAMEEHESFVGSHSPMRFGTQDPRAILPYQEAKSLVARLGGSHVLVRGIKIAKR